MRYAVTTYLEARIQLTGMQLDLQELEQKRQKLSAELKTYRQAIVQAVDEAQEMGIVLDRTAKLYMEALKERRQMINQWSQSVNVLRQRDNDIQNCLKV